jgi:hypothetical protein
VEPLPVRKKGDFDQGFLMCITGYYHVCGNGYLDIHEYEVFLHPDKQKTGRFFIHPFLISETTSCVRPGHCRRGGHCRRAHLGLRVDHIRRRRDGRRRHPGRRQSHRHRRSHRVLRGGERY